MRLLANGVHLGAPLWDHIDALGADADTVFADLVEVTFDVVEADRRAAEQRAKGGVRVGY